MNGCASSFDFEQSMFEARKDWNISFAQYLQAQGGVQIVGTSISTSPAINVVSSQVKNSSQDVVIVTEPIQVQPDAWVKIVITTNKPIPGGEVQTREATIVYNIVEHRTQHDI